ncbi:MAG: hypothetical protein V4696_08325 [Pseudomonadota bacterium]
MNSPSNSIVECRVIGGENLPAESGGADAFCAAVERAAKAGDPGQPFKVELHVKGASSLTAFLTTADGKALPEQKFSISDRGLTKGSLERFANTLVGVVARAASR